MSQNQQMILIDGDSIAHIAAYTGETLEEAKDVVDNTMDRIKSITWEGNYELYVETPVLPKVNFRHQVAITKPYKGHRTGGKPALLNDIKKYMYDRYGAEFINMVEAEDVVRIRAVQLGEEGCIIAHIDKDLDQIPGYHYNYKKGETSEVTHDEADYNFYKQMLTGDAVDNIPGLTGFGPKKSSYLLDPIRGRGERAYAEAVAKAYITKGCSYNYLVEQARLLYLIKSFTDVFIYPITIKEYHNLQEFYL